MQEESCGFRNVAWFVNVTVFTSLLPFTSIFSLQGQLLQAQLSVKSHYCGISRLDFEISYIKRAAEATSKCRIDDEKELQKLSSDK